MASRLEHGTARTFLGTTDFGASAVVVLQNARDQSNPDLAVESAPRSNTRGATADVTEDVLLV